MAGLTIQDIQQKLTDAGAKEKHLALFWRQLLAGQKPQSTRKIRFPKAVEALIPEILNEIDRLLNVEEAVADSSGSERLVLRVSDGEVIEAVLLPKEGLCLSTQVGCAVGCKFCMTGKGGLRRQLSDLEILTQLIVARKKREVHKVVFMGMGEPSHNLRAVLSALDWMATYGQIGYKELVLSTVGDRRLFEELKTRQIKPALALSLHSAFDQKRRDLLPHAKDIPVEEILAFTKEYAQLTHYPVQFQWTLIDGVNDGEDEIQQLGKIWKDQFAVLNMIPVNSVEGTGFKRPAPERLEEIAEELKSKRILVKYRNSAAQEVEGGCGQLRARFLKSEKASS